MQEDMIQLEYILSNENIADFFTKIFLGLRTKEFTSKLRLR